MASKPLQRSILELKKNGYLVAITERYNQFAHVRQDLFGFGDAVAIKTGETGVLAINACADNGGDVSTHVKKFTVLDPTDKSSQTRIAAVKTWLEAKNRLEVFGWGKRGDSGKRKLWTLRVVPVTLKMFEGN